MVPLRSSRATRSQAFSDGTPNRSRASQNDIDVFEGLPVRRWSRQKATYSQAPKSEAPETNIMGSSKLPELPMPKDSALLPPSSRALLRAARAGCTYIKPVRKDPEVEDKENKGANPKETPSYERKFTATKWATFPRNLDLPEVEFLAKRRPGLHSLYGAAAAASNFAADGAANTAIPPPGRKTKFKKVDPATGNVSIYEAWVPEGHKVGGEIVEEGQVTAENPGATVTVASPAPGTLIEGVGLVDQQGVVVAEPSMPAVVRKRHLPPKRKAKGIGRGRKKKVMFTSDVAPSQTPGTGTNHDAVQGEPSAAKGTELEPNKPTGAEEEDEDEDEGSDEDEESGAETKPEGSVTDPKPTSPSIETHSEPQAQGTTQPETHEPPPRDMSSSPDIPLAQGVATKHLEPTEPAPITTGANEEPTNPPAEADTKPVETESETKTPDEPSSAAVVSTSADSSAMPPPPVPATIPPLETLTAIAPETATEDNSTTQHTSPPPPPDSKPEPESTVHFEDGEVDLLGSLEASLDAGQEDKNAASPDAEKKESDNDNDESGEPGEQSTAQADIEMND